MFHYMWPTQVEKIPPIAVIGLVQPIGSLFPAVELQVWSPFPLRV